MCALQMQLELEAAQQELKAVQAAAQDKAAEASQSTQERNKLQRAVTLRDKALQTLRDEASGRHRSTVVLCMPHPASSQSVCKLRQGCTPCTLPAFDPCGQVLRQLDDFVGHACSNSAICVLPGASAQAAALLEH